MDAWRTIARRAALAGLLLVSVPGLLILSGCVVDEQEPGPNVQGFNYSEFMGQGSIGSAADSDVWTMTAGLGIQGRFDVTVALAPRASATVLVGSTSIGLSCPSSATANCMIGPAQDSRLRFVTSTTSSVSLTFQTSAWGGSALAYGFSIKNAPVCGNGYVENAEQCDDGNTTSGDKCSSTCTLELPTGCVSI